MVCRMFSFQNLLRVDFVWVKGGVRKIFLEHSSYELIAMLKTPAAMRCRLYGSVGILGFWLSLWQTSAHLAVNCVKIQSKHFLRPIFLESIVKVFCFEGEENVHFVEKKNKLNWMYYDTWMCLHVHPNCKELLLKDYFFLFVSYQQCCLPKLSPRLVATRLLAASSTHLKMQRELGTSRWEKTYNLWVNDENPLVYT